MNVEERVLDPMEYSFSANMDIEEIDAALDLYSDCFEGMVRSIGIDDYMWYLDEREYFLKNAKFRNNNQIKFVKMLNKLKTMGFFTIQNAIEDMQETKYFLATQNNLKRRIEEEQ